MRTVKCDCLERRCCKDIKEIVAAEISPKSMLARKVSGLPRNSYATGLFPKTGPRLTSSVNITFIIKNIGNYLEDFKTFVFLYPGLDSVVSNTLSLCFEEHLGMHGH